MMPPFNTPGNASYFGCGCHSATTSPFLAKLRMRRPSGFAGPQPQHEFSGAYCSLSDRSAIESEPTGVKQNPEDRDISGASGLCKASVGESTDCCRAAR